MSSPSYVTKTISILSIDNKQVSVGETTDRKQVVISIRDADGRVATARLSGDQFIAICGTRYELDVEDGRSEEAE